METTVASNFWWVKSNSATPNNNNMAENVPVSPLGLYPDISSSMAEFLEKERIAQMSNHTEADIGSIIDEINRLAAQSPLGPYEKEVSDRSIEDILQEAEKIYQESSKSFELLSSRSKTSMNVSEMATSSNSTPSPKSASSLPLDNDKNNVESEEETQEEESYTDAFTDDNKSELHSPSPKPNKTAEDGIIRPLINTEITQYLQKEPDFHDSSFSDLKASSGQKSAKELSESEVIFKDCKNDDSEELLNQKQEECESKNDDIGKLLSHKENELEMYQTQIKSKEEDIRKLKEHNEELKEDVKTVKAQLLETNALLEKTKTALNGKILKSPELNLELDNTLERLKDTKELNTALQLQLDSLNKTHQFLKSSYEELLNSNKNLEKRVVEVDTILAKYKLELLNVQQHRDQLLENETNLNKLLEIEKLHTKSLKQQNDKDARCIQDLNRQIKEMERIIARKHPDSVSALIVAAKNDAADTNMTARKVLEDRIKALEHEASLRDTQSSKVFLEVQEKFNQMKAKYESHIEDLELHVNDLKQQLKRKGDTFEMYTQTFFGEQKIPEKETTDASVQTDTVPTKPLVHKVPSVKRIEKVVEMKEETHLLATIRGLQADLANKEKVIIKLHKEIDDLKKTNKRLQKEREGSLKNLSERREFRSHPEKLSQYTKSAGNSDSGDRLDEELKEVKAERDKMKLQLCRIEEDYQALKSKRLQDLSTLQDAHEREIATYLTNITPLREQLEVQQVSVSTLQAQLGTAKEELAIITAERDHLDNRLNCSVDIQSFDTKFNSKGDGESAHHKQMVYIDKKYAEREHRLRAIVHNLAQKNVTNRSCEQCAVRQQQLIGYKVELDQLLATLRTLQ